MRDVQYDNDCAWAKEKTASDVLQTLRASVQIVRCHAELFRTKVSLYNDRFKTNLREGSPVFLTPFRDATKELVKQQELGIMKSVDVNFDVIDEILQALETELSHLELSLNAVD